MKIAYWATARIVGLVPPSVFVPRPNVDSALVEIIRRQPPATDPAILFPLIRTAFNQRRKMLRRSLSGVVTPEQFAGAGIDADGRVPKNSTSMRGARSPRKSTDDSTPGARRS